MHKGRRIVIGCYVTLLILGIISFSSRYWGWKEVQIDGYGKIKIPGGYEAEIIDERLGFIIEEGEERKVVLQEGKYEDGNSLEYKQTLNHNSNSSQVVEYEVRDTGEIVYALVLDLYKDGESREAVLFGSAKDVSPKDLNLMAESHTAEEFI